MSSNHFPKPHHPNTDVPDEFEPGVPPVEPDEGPVPANIPDDPEHDRIVDPAAKRFRQDLSNRRQAELAGCP